MKITRTTLETEVPVYDLTVPATETFVANGIVVHNCAEIVEPTAHDRTAVCCLSSLNLDKYDEWKNSTIVQDLIKMLDNVITYFINNASDPLKKAKYSATRERALGLGVMGFHHYLQKHMIPFESDDARNANKEIFSFINDQAIKATKELAIEHGEAPDFITKLTFHTKHERLHYSSSDMVEIKRDKEHLEVRAFQVKVGDKVEGHEIVEVDGLHANSGWRNTQLTAIAPTANSAILIGSSPSVEPSSANAYAHQTRAGTFPVLNPYLKALLEKKGLDNDETWNEITNNKGSIQHMNCFTEHEKSVFKTAIEINQMWVIAHAADRQPFVTQSQSINLFFPPRASKNYIHKVHRMAWKKGMKSLYYTRTSTPNRVESISSKITRIALKDGEEIDQAELEKILVIEQKNDEDSSDECVACQG